MALNSKLFEDSVEYVNQHRYHYGVQVVELDGYAFSYKCPHNTYIDRVFLYADSVTGTYTVTSSNHTLSLTSDSLSDIETTVVRIAPNTAYSFTPTGTATNPYLVIHTRSDRWIPTTNETTHTYSAYYPRDGDIFTIAAITAANSTLRTASQLAGSNRLAVVPLHYSLKGFSSADGTYVFRLPVIDTDFGQSKLVAISMHGIGASGPVITANLKDSGGNTDDTFTLTMSDTDEHYTESSLAHLIESSTANAQGNSANDYTLEVSSNSASAIQLNITLYLSNY
jgi:hypothetical protein